MQPLERTLPSLFERAAEKYSSNTFLLEKNGGEYKGMRYSDVRTAVHLSAAGLRSLGLAKGDRVALISEGRSDWVIAELGILYTGAINVPLSVKIEERAELQFRLAHSGCRMAIVSAGQAQKVFSLRRELPELEKIIVLDQEVMTRDDVIFFSRVQECGRKWLDEHGTEFENMWKSIRGDDPANICYTSGTTADPKGIVLTHRNYVANIEQSVALYPLPEWFVTLLILPWDHAFAHTDGIYALGSCGGAIASVQPGKTAMETLRNIPGNIKDVKPTFLLSVPALAKNFRKSIENGVRAKGKLPWALFQIGLRAGYAYNANGLERGRGWRKVLLPLYRLMDLIVFRNIRQNFGGRLQYFIGGGALLDVELQRFFYAIGMPMYQGYGLTEAAPVISANTPRTHKFGTSGVLVPSLDLRICDEEGHELPDGGRPAGGEIVVRGENVMPCYWRNEKATAETIRDGWLYTGDLGYVDEDGFLVVLGREKSLLIGHDGEKYSPEGIEETIVGEIACIDQIMLYNNQSPYTVALVVPNPDAVVSMMKRHRRDGTDPGGVASVLKFVKSEIESYRTGGTRGGSFPDRWLPSAIAIVEQPFTEQNRLLNSTLKMVRGRIATEYMERLEELFTSEGKEICTRRNMAAMEAVAKHA